MSKTELIDLKCMLEWYGKLLLHNVKEKNYGDNSMLEMINFLDRANRVLHDVESQLNRN